MICPYGILYYLHCIIIVFEFSSLQLYPCLLRVPGLLYFKTEVSQGGCMKCVKVDWLAHLLVACVYGEKILQEKH